MNLHTRIHSTFSRPCHARPVSQAQLSRLPSDIASKRSWGRRRQHQFDTACAEVPERPQSGGPPDDEEEEDSLRPEEDWTVKGGYQDSLSRNTQLGKAVDEACAELSNLGDLEREQLEKADDLLRKLGLKKSIVQGDNKKGNNGTS